MASLIVADTFPPRAVSLFSGDVTGRGFLHNDEAIGWLLEAFCNHTMAATGAHLTLSRVLDSPEAQAQSMVHARRKHTLYPLGTKT